MSEPFPTAGPVGDRNASHRAQLVARSAQIVLFIIVDTMRNLEAEPPSPLRRGHLKALRGARLIVSHIQRAAEEEAAAAQMGAR
jgi:hypothetical protein